MGKLFFRVRSDFRDGRAGGGPWPCQSAHSHGGSDKNGEMHHEVFDQARGVILSGVL
jgi:hypothetical protein